MSEQQDECRHSSRVGLPESGEIFYPEQENLRPGQVACTDGCGQVFDSEADLYRSLGYDVPEPEELECLDRHQHGHTCTGKVEMRYPLSGTGKSFPRCEGAWEKRLKKQQEINERYPDSPTPPAWFDPSYAGEEW